MLPSPTNDFEPLPSSSLRMRANYWVLTHFSTIRRAVIGALVAVCVLLFGWSAWGALPILRDPGLVDRIAAEVQSMRLYVPASPQPLELGEVSAVVIPGSTQLLATVTNPNDDRLASAVSYEFRRPDGTAVAAGWMWLLPHETRYAAGVAAGEAADVELVVAARQWQRQRESNPVPPLQLAAREVALQYVSGQPSRVTFVAVNGETVGYQSVAAVAVARTGGAVVAVGVLRLADLASGEERPSAVTWYHAVPAGAQVEVQLVTDPFDRANVLLPE